MWEFLQQILEFFQEVWVALQQMYEILAWLWRDFLPGMYESFVNIWKYWPDIEEGLRDNYYYEMDITKMQWDEFCNGTLFPLLDDPGEVHRKLDEFLNTHIFSYSGMEKIFSWIYHKVRMIYRAHRYISYFPEECFYGIAKLRYPDQPPHGFWNPYTVPMLPYHVCGFYIIAIPWAIIFCHHYYTFLCYNGPFWYRIPFLRFIYDKIAKTPILCKFIPLFQVMIYAFISVFLVWFVKYHPDWQVVIMFKRIWFRGSVPPYVP